jgi:hypothetical protein
MTGPTRIISSIACAAFLAVALLPQDNPPAAQSGNPIIAALPTARGIYYHAAQGWVALSHSALMPFEQERPMALEILNVGSDHSIVEMPGPRAGVQIGSDARPTFYLRGIATDQL